jgi:hypothetical protein
MKKDKYFRERGGTAKIINVNCMNCGRLLFVYQKDGPGWLKRCYLNRILSPEKYSNLQKDKKINKPSDLDNLICECGNIIGSPMQYKDKRLAFSLIRGKFKRSNNKSDDWT